MEAFLFGFVKGKWVIKVHAPTVRSSAEDGGRKLPICFQALNESISKEGHKGKLPICPQAPTSHMSDKGCEEKRPSGSMF